MSDHHHHHDHHGHHHHHNSVANIKLALILNLSFAIIELIGGFLTQSVAILSDAIHDFGDSLALGFSYALEKKSKQQSNAKYSYGYKRLSLLSAVITSVFLIVASIFVLIEAFERVSSPVQPYTPGMIGLAILGIAVNGFAAWRTSHGHSMNEKVISWHMIEDLLGWIVVLIGSIVMYFVDFPLLDPLLSIGFSLFIIRGVYKNLLSTTKLFLQGVPEHIDLHNISKTITNIEGVKSIHDCHLWSLDGESHVLTLHVVIMPDINITHLEQLKISIRESIKNMGTFHLTIEFETSNENCLAIDCVNLQNR